MLEDTILAIRREFSHDEKYKLLLRHLNNIEDELAREQKYINSLLKKNNDAAATINNLNQRLKNLEEELMEYKGGEDKKKFVKKRSYLKLERTKKMWEDRFWEVNEELNQLKNGTKAG